MDIVIIVPVYHKDFSQYVYIFWPLVQWKVVVHSELIMESISPFHSQVHTKGCCQSRSQHCLCSQIPQSLEFLSTKVQKKEERK